MWKRTMKTGVLLALLLIMLVQVTAHSGTGSTTNNNYNYNYTTNNYNYTNKTVVYNQPTTNNYTYTTNVYQTNQYTYKNSYQDSSTYVYYNFGGDCPDSGCKYVCHEPNCTDRMSNDNQTTVLTNKVDLEILETAYPRYINAGQQIQFEMTVRNRGKLDANHVELTVQAYGQVKTLENLTLRSGQQKTFTVPFTVPKTASGPEDVQLQATALDTSGNVMERDIATVPIEVQDIHLTMHLTPQRVVVGDPVTISGMMSQTNLSANLYVAGFYIATVRSDENKHYSHSVITQQPGVFRVELRSGNARQVGFLRVDPKIGVIDTNIPETVNTQDPFQTCATTFSATSTQAQLDLLINGQPVKSDTFVAQGEQHKCFQTVIRQTGTHNVTFRITANGVSNEATHPVNVIESRIQVNVFPQSLTLETGHSGVFQVTIQNHDMSSRTFTIRTDGLSAVTEATEQHLALGSGETRTAYIRIVPPLTGLYQGNISVAAGNVTYADTQVTVFANENPALKGPLSRAGAAVQHAVRYVQDRAAFIGISLGIIIVLIILGMFLYRRGKQSEVIEPRY